MQRIERDHQVELILEGDLPYVAHFEAQVRPNGLAVLLPSKGNHVGGGIHAHHPAIRGARCDLRRDLAVAAAKVENAPRVLHIQQRQNLSRHRLLQRGDLRISQCVPLRHRSLPSSVERGNPSSFASRNFRSSSPVMHAAQSSPAFRLLLEHCHLGGTVYWQILIFNPGKSPGPSGDERRYQSST